MAHDKSGVSKPNMELSDFICYLRQELLNAREQKDQHKLATLFSVFGVLSDAAEASYPTHDGRVIGIVEDLYCSTRDSLAGVDWKSTIPTEEEIRRATS